VIARTLALPFAFIGIMLVSLFISIIIEWLGLYFYWPDQGWHHAQGMLNSELKWISDSYVQNLVLHQPDKVAKELINLVYEWVFEKPD
jgi:integrating conjugative element membrane protein (TIGR03747 family)